MQANKGDTPKPATLNPKEISVAFEKLFAGGRGVERFSRSKLRYVNLGNGAVLIEQNPKKHSEWARLVAEGHRIAWVMCDSEYLARVVDSRITILNKNETT